MASESLRIYFKTNTSPQFLRFLWFKEYRPNEMMFGINGLTSTISVLDSISPDRIVTNEDLRALRFNYSDATTINEKVNHITCHTDGTFHIKTIDGKEVYRDTVRRQERLGVNIKTFLNFFVISDRVLKYSDGIPKPEIPNYVISCNENDLFLIKGMFSGAKYSLENDLNREITSSVPSGGIFMLCSFNGKYFRGLLLPIVIQLDNAVLNKKPSGTIVVFKFPYHNNKYLIKAFVFS